MKPAKVLVTGSKGFIGSQLVKELYLCGYVVRESSRDFNNVLHLTQRTFEEKFDYIIHCAVVSEAGGYCWNSAGTQFLVNTNIMASIFNYWRNFQTAAKLIIFGSSCSYNPDIEKYEENFLKDEVEPGYEVYGNLKRLEYIGANSMKKEFNMDFSMLVPSTVYGPGYKLTDKHFIYELIRKIVAGKTEGAPVTLWGDGAQQRELIYIDNVISAIKHAMKNDVNIMNISSGRVLSIKQYAKIISDIVGYDHTKIKYDETQFVGAKAKRLHVDKLVSTGEVFTSAEVGLKRTIKYYLKESGYADFIS
ncbi:MAG: NAD-dependent epimerase/dehydratase family protein [Spirochaetes bacterium]|nr:NAD-dependent epimerase/dehydratase family protein [Spirochaetota bacterium]